MNRLNVEMSVLTLYRVLYHTRNPSPSTKVRRPRNKQAVMVSSDACSRRLTPDDIVDIGEILWLLYDTGDHLHQDYVECGIPTAAFNHGCIVVGILEETVDRLLVARVRRI